MVESPKRRAVSEKQKRLARRRKRTMKLGALNITIHPHSPSMYVELLSMARRMKSSILLRGRTFGRIGVFRPLEKDSLEGPYYGEFHRYIDIPIDGRWYDTEKRAQAEVDDVKRVVIPANLKPVYEPFRFLFFPSNHRLFFQSKSHDVGDLSPWHAKRILDGLFSNPSVIREYGRVDVVVEPEADAIERILSLPALRRLKIEVRRPNADDLSDAQQRVFDRLEEEGAREWDQEFIAVRGQALTPSPDTVMVARVAASNGKVEGVGRGRGGISATVSTVNYPWIEPVTYRPTAETEMDAFIGGARSMSATIDNRARSEPMEE